ncbi:cytochrome P450 [Pseudovirgaria hyperparasitica]|uniref:Cytochrome P450 n=1 Tax=Pseudovirgaria hyperparasitica TaxID=470096 RepID=A0A6A6W826_9PEZI|nr:cytochrome P450 [Pseudovirgaria hyperparasitica]KAF2757737.1 cytochrome P450 [Pseudovirgaria hyperparasitica]
MHPDPRCNGLSLLSLGLYGSALLTGPVMHLGLWIRGEWDRYVNHILFLACFIHNAGILILHYLTGADLLDALAMTVTLEGAHLLGLMCSIGLYRICFHPLRFFPGPLSFRISIWGRTWATFHKGERGAILIDEVHRRYGDYVRIAPNHISVRSASSIPLIHGTGKTTVCHKSAAYLNPVNFGSVNATRDPNEHAIYRKKWDKALDPKAASSYLPAIHQVVLALVSRLRYYQGRPIVANHEYALFAFDTMGRIGFGLPNGFNSMPSGRLPRAIADVVATTRIGVYMVNAIDISAASFIVSHHGQMFIPWLHMITGILPTFGIIYKPDVKFREFIGAAIQEKSTTELPEKRQHQAHKDVISHLMDSSDGVKLSHSQLLSNGFIIGLAGSDTTISTITHMTYRFARHPNIARTLHQEISSALSHRGTPADWPAISKLPYLDAFINETLRLHPPNPSPLPRVTPPEGLYLDDGVYIPGGVNVSTPEWSLHHDSRYFSEPEVFMPERWIAHDVARTSGASFTPRPECIFDRRAFIPFLRGPYRCAGIYVAYMELKMWTAAVLMEFDIVFPEGVDVQEVDRRVRDEWKDYTMTQAAPIEVCFRERL